MLGLARYAGLRAEEAVQLPWKCVDFEKGRIAITPRNDWQPKDGDKRTVPVSPMLFEMLVEARNADPHGDMVVPKGVVIFQNIWRDFGSVFRRSGVQRYSKPMHSLRKRCISDWADKHSAHEVQAWAGHSDYRTTAQFYPRVSDDAFHRATGLAQKVVQNPDSGPLDRRKLKRASGFEPLTSSLGSWHSTTELRPQFVLSP